MSIRRQMYEGDSLIHAGPCSASQTRADEPPAGESPQSGGGAAVAKRRSAAMRGFFPKLSVWLSNRIHFARMREIDSYLSQATDLADLERRIARIERGAHWH